MTHFHNNIRHLMVLVFILQTFYASAESNVTFDCRSKQCMFQTMICDENKPCFIDCAYDDGYADIEYDEACQQSLVICGTNATCTLICDGNEACDRLRIDATRATELTVNCSNHYESCHSLQFSCPSSGLCSTTVPDTMYTKSLNPAIGFTVSNHFNCTVFSCKEQTLLCEDNVDCSIDCGGTAACIYTAILCPSNAKCDILCNGTQSCLVMNAYASDSTELNVMCGDYHESCAYTAIICPNATQYGKCKFEIYNEQNNVSDMYIYALNGNDVVFHSTEQVPSDIILLQCGDKFQSVCDLRRLNLSKTSLNPFVSTAVLSTDGDKEVTESTSTTNYTVHIEIKECDDDCNVQIEDIGDLKERIIQTLIAEATDIQIVSTEIKGDEIIILISVETSYQQILESDTIKEYIEKEVEDDDTFGDIDVSVQNDDVDDDETATESKDTPWIVPVIIISVIAICIVFLLYCLYRYYNKRKTAQEIAGNIVELSTVEETTQPPGTVQETVETIVEQKTQDIERDPQHQDGNKLDEKNDNLTMKQMRENKHEPQDSELLYNYNANETVKTTTGGNIVKQTVQDTGNDETENEGERTVEGGEQPYIARIEDNEVTNGHQN